MRRSDDTRRLDGTPQVAGHDGIKMGIRQLLAQSLSLTDAVSVQFTGRLPLHDLSFIVIGLPMTS